jgi:hypothetical protein
VHSSPIFLGSDRVRELPHCRLERPRSRADEACDAYYQRILDLIE